MLSKHSHRNRKQYLASKSVGVIVNSAILVFTFLIIGSVNPDDQKQQYHIHMLVYNTQN